MLTSLHHPREVMAAEDWASCSNAGIRVEDSPSSAWRAAVLELCAGLLSLTDRDRGATVFLAGVGDNVELSVWLRDGRHTQRHIHSPAALREVVEALVALPPAPASGNDLVPYGIQPRLESPNAGSDPQALQVEIGGGVVGRFSGSPNYLSAGAAAGAGLHWGNWLFGLNLRFEPWTRVSAGYLPRFEMSTAGLGFMIGRNVFAASSLSVDAAIATTLLTEAQSVQLSEREVSGSESDVRVGALVRCLLGSSPFRPALVLDADVSPARAGREIRAAEALAPLPSWSLGLGLGLTWLEP